MASSPTGVLILGFERRGASPLAESLRARGWSEPSENAPGPWLLELPWAGLGRLEGPQGLAVDATRAVAVVLVDRPETYAGPLESWVLQLVAAERWTRDRPRRIVPGERFVEEPWEALEDLTAWLRAAGLPDPTSVPGVPTSRVQEPGEVAPRRPAPDLRVQELYRAALALDLDDDATRRLEVDAAFAAWQQASRPPEEARGDPPALTPRSLDISSLRRMLAESRRDLHWVLNSRSWRYAAPIRNLKRAAYHLLAGGRPPGPLRRALLERLAPGGSEHLEEPWFGGAPPPAHSSREDTASAFASCEGPRTSAEATMQAEARAFLSQRGRIRVPESAAPVVSVIILLFNKAHLTYSCLTSLMAATSTPTEVLLVDNASRDETADLLARVDGARIVTNQENVGFVRGCNQAAALARGKHLLFLNNDTRLLPGTLDHLVAVLEAREDVGAVGGRLIHLDGRLQEAGSLVWRDGTTAGYGRGADPLEPEFAFLREVDYCSGALLLTPRATFERLGGFDEAFVPAYYEEVDYCFRLRKLGLRVLYQPEATALHLEFGSAPQRGAGIELQSLHREIFRQRHADALEAHLEAHTDDQLTARSPRRDGPRTLYIDDRVPHPGVGQGFPRAHALLLGIRELSAHVTFFPTTSPDEAWSEVYSDVPRDVEVMTGFGHAGLADFLRMRAGYYDTVVVSRPHNMAFLQQAVARHPDLLAGARLVYDAEALFASRELHRATLQGETSRREELEAEVKAELALTRGADTVVTVSAAEAEAFREAGCPRVHVLPHVLSLRPTPRPFLERSGFLFVGSLLEGVTPNTDSLRWFVAEVLPRLRAKLPGARLRIVGRVQSRWIRELDEEAVDVVGYLDDLTDEYDRARVFVAPTRFAAGIPLKVLEAASYGLPAVVTDLLEQQLGWSGGRDHLAASRRDAAAFADACVRLHGDDALWSRLRTGAQERVGESCSRERLHRLLRAVLLGEGALP